MSPRSTTDPVTGLRPCPRCDRALPLEAFGLDRHGYARGYCRPCQADHAREWRAYNRDRLLARKRERYRLARAAGLSPLEATAARDRRPMVPDGPVLLSP